MKESLAILVLVCAFGASDQVFGINTAPYQSPDELVPTQLEHYEAAID